MKTVFRISVLPVLLVSAIAYAGDAKEEEVFPSFNSRAVVDGASLTWQNYVEWWNKTRGTPLRGDLELGTNLWAEGIARLKPEYVYTHGVNIVIVRSRHGEDEEGFYVALSIASSPGPNDEQFTRMLIAPHAGGSDSSPASRAGQSGKLKGRLAVLAGTKLMLRKDQPSLPLAVPLHKPATRPGGRLHPGKPRNSSLTSSVAPVGYSAVNQIS